MEEETATTMEREWRGSVMRHFDRLELQMRSDIGEVSKQIDHLYEQLRAEHLDKATYNVAHTALVERVTRIERGPQRALGWISLAISGGIGCLSLLIGAAAVVTSIVLYATNH